MPTLFVFMAGCRGVRQCLLFVGCDRARRRMAVPTLLGFMAGCRGVQKSRGYIRAQKGGEVSRAVCVRVCVVCVCGVCVCVCVQICLGPLHRGVARQHVHCFVW